MISNFSFKGEIQMDKKIINPISDVFKYLAISVLFMFIGFILGQMFIPESVAYLANFIMILLLLFLVIMAICSKKNVIPTRFSMNFVYIFTFIDGIAMYPILQMYIGDLGSIIVINILIGVIVMFAALSFISLKKEAGHYLGLGKILFTGLLALLVLIIFNIFFNFKIFNIFVSILGISIFAGYVLYDISLLKYDIEQGNIVDRDDLSIHVLNLYLDFVNLLLDLLRLVREFVK